MRELDALLIRFVEDVYESLSKDDKRRFSTLLELPDPDLCAYLLRRDEPKDHEIKLAVDLILSHVDG